MNNSRKNIFNYIDKRVFNSSEIAAQQGLAWSVGNNSRINTSDFKPQITFSRDNNVNISFNFIAFPEILFEAIKWDEGFFLTNIN